MNYLTLEPGKPLHARLDEKQQYQSRFLTSVALNLQRITGDNWQARQTLDMDERPYGIPHLYNDTTGEEIFTSSAYNEPHKIKFSGMWPEAKTLSGSIERFTPHADAQPEIGLSDTRDPLDAAKAIVNRFLPPFRRLWEAQAQVRERFYKCQALEQQAREAVLAFFPERGRAERNGDYVSVWVSTPNGGTVEVTTQHGSNELTIKIRDLKLDALKPLFDALGGWSKPY